MAFVRDPLFLLMCFFWGPIRGFGACFKASCRRSTGMCKGSVRIYEGSRMGIRV